jgi:hypothetical protein
LIVTGLFYGMPRSNQLNVGPFGIAAPPGELIGFGTAKTEEKGVTRHVVTPVARSLPDDPPTVSITAEFTEEIAFEHAGIELRGSNNRVKARASVDSVERLFQISSIDLSHMPGMTAIVVQNGVAGRKHSLRFNVWYKAGESDPGATVTFTVIGMGPHRDRYDLGKVVIKLDNVE